MDKNDKRQKAVKQRKQNQKKSQKEPINKTQPPRKKAQPVAAAVKEKYHGRGFDVRTKTLARFASSGNPAGHNTVLDMSLTPSIDSIIGVVIGFVGQLRAAGYGSVTGQLSYPFFLSNYLYDMILKSMAQQTLPVTEVPLCLLNLFQAVRPKVVRYKIGQMNYSWQLDNPPPTIPAVSSVGNIQYNMGVVGPVADWSLMFPTIVAPDGYTEQEGALAYSQMLAFLKSIDDQNPMHQLVPISEKTWSMHDVTAFSQVYPERGSAAGVGGFTTEIFNANKLRTPIYAVFSEYSTDEIAVAEARITAGTPRFLGSRLATMAMEGRLSNKFKPIFKPVDFNDLWNSFNYMIGTALETALTSNLVSTTALVMQCPLTAKQVALIMRASLASLNNVAMVSDLTTQNFQPLQFHYACMNVSTTVKSWEVPYVFSENIRSLNMVAAGIPSDNSNQVFLYAPVFGIYDEVNDYNFTYADNNSIYFQPGEPEPDFNMANLFVGNTSQFIAPVGNELATAITIWNDWFRQFTSVIRQTPFCSDQNNPALYSILTTRYTTVQVIAETQPTKNKLAKTVSKKKVMPCFKDILRVVKAVNPNTIINEQEVSVSSNVPILNETFQLTNSWVIPKIRLQAFESTPYIAKFYAQNYESFFVTSAPSEANGVYEYISLTSKWTNLGVIATNGPSSAPNSLLGVLENAEKRGEGGFLGQILADFAATQFNIPFLSQLGAIIPF